MSDRPTPKQIDSAVDIVSFEMFNLDQYYSPSKYGAPIQTSFERYLVIVDKDGKEHVFRMEQSQF